MSASSFSSTSQRSRCALSPETADIARTGPLTRRLADCGEYAVPGPKSLCSKIAAVKSGCARDERATARDDPETPPPTIAASRRFSIMATVLYRQVCAGQAYARPHEICVE